MIPILRQEILERRRLLDQSETAELSHRVCRHFIEVSDRVLGPDFWNRKKVGIYRTQYSVIPGELDPLELEKVLIRRQSRLFFPRVRDQAIKLLEFAEIIGDSSDGDQWTRGPYGLHEPAENQEIIRPEDFDVIFVPGVAFGRAGERIGMGAGYYDRYLEKVKKALRISLAFDFQIRDQLEQNPWDQKVHWVISETQEIRHAN